MAPVNEFATLDELSVGVVTTFQPTEEDLVGYYLYNKVYDNPPFSTYKTFPEIPIYGKDGVPPWEIWRSYQQIKFPHQDFIYFFSWAEKLNPNKSRNSRKVGTDGSYTWSETEAKKPVCVCGFQEAVGSLRKFRFEKTIKKDKKGKQVETRASQIDDEHHGAWLMDEFTINHAPDLALCRLKSKRKQSSAEEDENLRTRQSPKKRKLEPTRSYQNSSSMSEQQEAGTTSQQMPSSYVHENDQVAQVVPEGSYNKFPDELEQMLMSDDDCVDDENLTFSPTLNDAALRACIPQSIPNEQQPNQEQYSHCSEEYQGQLPQQDQASSSHSNEQHLLTDNDFDVSLDDLYQWILY